MAKEIFVPVEISARHIHLSREDADILFGKNHKFKALKKLSQGEDFASEETVEIEVNETTLRKVRVVGPLRKATQLELTLSDSHFLKTDIPFRLSGEVAGSRGFRVVGPAGLVDKKEGMIVAKRHLHLNSKDAKEYSLKTGDLVNLNIGGERETTFHQVIVRVADDYQTMVHLDVDEANAAGLKSCGRGKLILL